ncbi:hypothetical protein [Neopusillimonas maritima]|uniref:Helix-turn-helix domain-containing protein n=1 Tax=Neopusillimonas maritima TaxID=2026239 RepID=A0ABX9MYG4_9BURK|nr:hypothetical protein [Neopusillimonas maritima]RII84030.1 hypothetical protein CJO09_02000 [Neopusillimonas maritima]
MYVSQNIRSFQIDSEKGCTALDALTKPTVDTATAAFYLNRKPQTLRVWACRENGPIRPLRVNGRLAWRVADIKAIIGV